MRLRPTSWLFVTFAMSGCASGSAPQAAVDVQPPAASGAETGPASAAPPADDPPLPLERRAERAACDGRDGCALLKLRKAGIRGDDTLHVAFVEHEKEVKRGAPRPPQRTAPLETEGNDEVLGAEYDGCTNIEVWLLSDGKQGALREQLLGEACNDGYGASGVGQDTFTFDEKGIFAHSRYGGSAWRWGETTTLSLDPPTIVKSEWNGHWNVAQNNESSTFDYRTLAGKTEWENEPCDPGGGPPTQQGGPVEHFAYAAIPEIDPRAITGVDIDKAPLGACAAVIDGKQAGYVLSGSEETSSSAMRIVAEAGALHVEIDDDKFVDKGARRDELEVWFAEKPADYTEHCLPKHGRPSGFAIPLSAGKVRTLAGSLAEPEVVRTATQGEGTRRLKIEILPRMEGITVVYRDTDDGKKVGRALATSDLDLKKEASLGRLRKVDAARVTCVMSNGKLTVVLPPVPDKTLVFGI